VLPFFGCGLFGSTLGHTLPLYGIGFAFCVET